MKNIISCPRCQSEHVTISSKSIHILFGLGMAIIGLGLLVPALSRTKGYYLFAFPLCIVGLLTAYNGINDRIGTGHCRDCNHKFNSVLDR